MSRYLLKPDDKASINRKEYFNELGLYDFWLLSTKIIEKRFPPYIEINNIEDAFKILKLFISECGNSINIDFPDGYNTNNLTGIETENITMKLIWYTVDRAYEKIEGDEDLSKEIIEINKNILGENLEQQYGFTFDYLIMTSSYILIYAKEREVPEEIETKDEILTKDRIHHGLKIYEHHWGSYSHEPILQYRTRYYCNKGLVAVLWPKGATRSFHVEKFFKH
jgi:hypothetical protein